MAKNKNNITDRQVMQFNKMLFALQTIAKKYQTPDQLGRSSKGDMGIDYEEAIGMAYENIQATAAEACKGVKSLIFIEVVKPKKDICEELHEIITDANKTSND